MEAILKFNLDEDNDKFLQAVKATEAHLCLWEMDQWLRGNLKYASDSTPDDEIEGYQKSRDQLREIMSSYNVSFDD
jgi:hypothetical protein